MPSGARADRGRHDRRADIALIVLNEPGRGMKGWSIKPAVAGRMAPVSTAVAAAAAARAGPRGRPGLGLGTDVCVFRRATESVTFQAVRFDILTPVSTTGIRTFLEVGQGAIWHMYLL